MSEYWKSTPSYWCKFCSQYVRDTAIERKNHEATAKHQNNIQRSLRDLHKNQEREKREKQQAKDEVARLNGLVSGKGNAATVKPPGPAKSSHPAPALNAAAQRRAHAEQLAALGVELPEELKKEITGVESYHVVSERTVEPAQEGSVSVNRSLADILAEAKRQEENGYESAGSDDDAKSSPKRAIKRKVEDDEDSHDEEAPPKRKAWGSSLKTYPGSNAVDDDSGDLDALLNGVTKKGSANKPEVLDSVDSFKKEDSDEADAKPLDSVPEVKASGDAAAPKEELPSSTAPAVVFKKRKGKK